jgi:hypothetical protein
MRHRLAEVNTLLTQLRVPFGHKLRLSGGFEAVELGWFSTRTRWRAVRIQKRPRGSDVSAVGPPLSSLPY